MFESYEEDYAAAAKNIGRHISEIGGAEGNFGAQKAAIKSAHTQIKEAENFVSGVWRGGWSRDGTLCVLDKVDGHGGQNTSTVSQSSAAIQSEPDSFTVLCSNSATIDPAIQERLGQPEKGS